MKRKQKNVLIRKSSHVEFCPNSTDDETKEWEEGIVLSIQGRGRSRKYSIRSLKKSDLQVFRFPWQVRPVPPEAYLVSPAVGNVVEAFDVSHQCWRRGVITDILLTNPDYLIVYHEYINGHYLHHRSDLRQALQWRDNSWSLVPNASLPERCFQGETSVGSCPAPFDLETDAQTEGSKNQKQEWRKERQKRFV